MIVAMSPILLHLSVLSFQACVLAAIVMLLFRLRTRFGLTFFVVSVVLINSIEGGVRVTELVPDQAYWMQHFGGTLLFSVKLLAVLLIYLREDAIEARALLYGVAAAAFCVVLMVASQGLHLLVAGVDLSLIKQPIIRAAIHLFGMVILLLDAVVLILVYEWTSQRVRGLFVPVLLALLAALSLDNVIYYLLYSGSEGFGQLLLLSFLGKWYAALIYAACFTIGTRYIGLDAESQTQRRLGDVYETLSFRQRFEALRRTADVDALTGLYTRARLEADAKQLLDQPDQSLWILDLDHFKRVNDEHGHLRGDEVLREVAERIRANLPSTAQAYRYGGEEFVILGRFSASDAEGLRLAIAETPIAGLAITVSMGSAYSTDGQRLRSLFALADQRLYKAKALGRNQCVSG
jgi:diguanylate cyclase (GGDEF)-like protein